MKRVVIFGNSGSGKSTLAKRLSNDENLAHLDLDSIAWQSGSPPERKPIIASQHQIDLFLGSNDAWVIEGCYSDLLELTLAECTEIVFLNLSNEACIANAKSRPWEPHKYDSKAAQDANLEMLLDWIADYEERDDTFSKKQHMALFDRFDGKKTMYLENVRFE